LRRSLPVHCANGLGVSNAPDRKSLKWAGKMTAAATLMAPTHCHLHDTLRMTVGGGGWGGHWTGRVERVEGVLAEGLDRRDDSGQPACGGRRDVEQKADHADLKRVQCPLRWYLAVDEDGLLCAAFVGPVTDAAATPIASTGSPDCHA